MHINENNIHSGEDCIVSAVLEITDSRYNSHRKVRPSHVVQGDLSVQAFVARLYSFCSLIRNDCLTLAANHTDSQNGDTRVTKQLTSTMQGRFRHRRWTHMLRLSLVGCSLTRIIVMHLFRRTILISIQCSRVRGRISSLL